MKNQLKKEMLKQLSVLHKLVIEKAFEGALIELKIISPANMVVLNYAETVFVSDFIVLSPRAELNDVQIEEFYDRNINYIKDWINVLKK